MFSFMFICFILLSVKPMIHGSTSFNFCWSTNVELCCDLLKRCCNLLNTRSTFVEQQQLILARSWNGGGGNVAVALRFERCRRYHEASTKTTKNRKIWMREWLRNRTIFRAYYTPVGRTQKLGHFKLQKFPAYGCHVLRRASPAGGPNYHAPGDKHEKYDTTWRKVRLNPSVFCHWYGCFIENSVYNNVSLFINPCEVLSRQTAAALSLMSRFLWSFDLISYRHGKVSYRLISWLVLSKLHSNSADSNSSATMLIFPRSHVTPNSKNDWFKPFNNRQLVERNRAKFYFRSTTFNNFQHVERHISTFNITWYTVNICWTAAATFVAQQMLNCVSLALKNKKRQKHPTFEAAYANLLWFSWLMINELNSVSFGWRLTISWRAVFKSLNSNWDVNAGLGFEVSSGGIE